MEKKNHRRRILAFWLAVVMVITSFLVMPVNVLAETAETFPVIIINDLPGTVSDQDGEGNFEEGDIVEIKAGTKEGYEFVNWSSDSSVVFEDENSPDTAFSMLSEAVAIQANWRALFTITINSIGGNAINFTATPSPAALGDTVTLNAGSNPGYNFVNWTSVPPVTFADANNAITTFDMPGSDVVVTANWVVAPATFTVTVNGSQLPAGTGDNQSGQGNYVPGATVTIRAGTRSGFTFNGWTVNAGGVTLAAPNNATTTFTMPANNVVVTARWTDDDETIITENIGIVLSAEDNRGIQRDIRHSYFGGRIDFGRRANENYAAIPWRYISIWNRENRATGQMTVELSGADASSFALSGGSGTATRRTISSISANNDREDAFSVRPVTRLPARDTPYRARVTVSNDNVYASFEVRFRVGEGADGETFRLTLRSTAGGSVSVEDGTYGETRTIDVIEGDSVTISARPNRDFVFDEWTYTHGEVVRPGREETTFIMPDRDTTIWARFIREDDAGPGAHLLEPLPEQPVIPGLPPAQQPMLPPGQMPGLWQDVTPVPEPVPIAPVLVPLSVYINGIPLALNNQPAVMANGVPLIPVGDFFRALDYTVEWDAVAREATMRRGTLVIVIPVGSRSFTINGVGRNLRSPAMIINDHMMVPFVEVIESIGGRTHLTENGVINVFITR